MDAKRRYRSRIQLQMNKLYPITDADVCQDCGGTYWLSHHHMDRDLSNSSPDNVAILCHRCHLRLHRQAVDVGSRSRLTEHDLKRIRDRRIPLRKLAKEIGMNKGYLWRIRNGKRNPLPVEQQRKQTIIPPHWEYKDMRGKPRALSVPQVREMLQHQPILGKKKAIAYAKKFNVSLASIYKAYKRRGCYSEPEYNLQ